MYIEHTIPCALNSKQLAVTFRDLSRSVNYESTTCEVMASSRGLFCRGWQQFPEWVRSAEVRRGDGEIVLCIDVVENVCSGEVDMLFENLATQLASLVSYPVKAFPQRVFCIGWSKTGTTSITEALRMLGLFSWHCAPWVAGLKHRTDRVDLPSIDFTSIVDYTAVSDLPIYVLFKELDVAFPGSLFILTTRSVEEWIESIAALWNHQVRENRTAGSVLQWVYGAEVLDNNILRERYTRHEKEVLEYFGNRKDLLVLDITRGNPWLALCDFLKLPEPDVPFPHLNRRPAAVPRN